MVSLPENPRSLGDLVGLGFRTLRLNWKLVLAVFFVPSLIFSFSMSGLEWCFVHWLESKSFDMTWFAVHMTAAFALVIIMVACQWEIAIRSCAYIRFLLQGESEYRSAYEFARGRQWAIMLVYFVSFLVPFVVTVVWSVAFVMTIWLGRTSFIGKVLCIPLGFIEGASFVVVGCFAMLYTALCFVAIAIDAKGAKDALVLGYKLSIVKLPRGLSYICLLVTAIMLFALPLYLPIGILGIWEGYVQGKINDPQFPLYLRVLDAASGCFVNIVSIGVALAGLSLYYRDLRMRIHGQDILQQLEKVDTADSIT